MKPENILVCKSGVVKICDFGFARMLSEFINVLRMCVCMLQKCVVGTVCIYVPLFGINSIAQAYVVHVCVCTHLCVCLSTYLFVCVRTCVHVSLCMYVCMYVYLSVCLSVCLSTYVYLCVVCVCVCTISVRFMCVVRMYLFHYYILSKDIIIILYHELFVLNLSVLYLCICTYILHTVYTTYILL